MTTPAPSRDTSSSGGKVFAKASKEWTIPPRPRPGRKAAETAPKTGKSAQNREAQRAFRERKQDYVAELEQRCRDYEQQEVQKNISLQTISLALKAENQTLKSDNDRLKALVDQLGGDPTVTPGSSGSGTSTRAGGGAGAGRKRKKVKVEEFDDSFAGDAGSRAGSASRSGSIVGEGSSTGEGGGRGKSSPSSAYQQQEARRPSSSSSATPKSSNFQATAYFPSSSTILARPSTSISAPIASPHDHSPHSHSHPHPHSRPPTPTAATLNPPSFSYASSFVPSCGFCTTNDTPCICRMAAESRDLHAGFTGLLNSSDVSPKPSPAPAFGVDYPASHVSSSTGGGAVSLPSAYLRRRNSGASHQAPAAIWSYTSIASSSATNSSSTANSYTTVARSTNTNPSTTPSSPSLVAPIFNPSFGFDASNKGTVVAASDPNSLPSCTGNPQDCAACADDPFGKAFCETLEGAEDDDGGERGEMMGGGCSSASGVPCGNCSETAKSKAAGGDGPIVELACCGVPEACGSSTSTSSSCVGPSTGGGLDESGSHKTLVLGGGSSARSHSSMSTSSFAGSEEPEGTDSHGNGGGLMVPTSTAWRQFKSHPNTTFADLSLLAEVVSRRIPACALSPNPHGSSSLPPPNSFVSGSPFTAPSPSSSFVKLEEEDVSMGSIFGGSVPPGSRKRRRAEVEVEGVREALRILDARGKRGPGGEVLLTASSIQSVAPGVVEVAAGKTGRRMSDIRGTLDEFGMEQDEEEQEQEQVVVRNRAGDVGMMVMMA